MKMKMSSTVKILKDIHKILVCVVDDNEHLKTELELVKNECHSLSNQLYCTIREIEILKLRDPPEQRCGPHLTVTAKSPNDFLLINGDGDSSSSSTQLSTISYHGSSCKHLPVKQSSATKNTREELTQIIHSKKGNALLETDQQLQALASQFIAYETKKESTLQISHHNMEKTEFELLKSLAQQVSIFASMQNAQNTVIQNQLKMMESERDSKIHDKLQVLTAEVRALEVSTETRWQIALHRLTQMESRLSKSLAQQALAHSAQNSVIQSQPNRLESNIDAKVHSRTDTKSGKVKTKKDATLDKATRPKESFKIDGKMTTKMDDMNCKVNALLTKKINTKLGDNMNAKMVHCPMQPKSAVCQLNEIQAGLKYVLRSQEGPTHCPIFEMTVNVNGKTYVGHGRSKKLAKQSVAESVLASRMQFIREEQSYPMRLGFDQVVPFAKGNHVLDFSSNDTSITFDMMTNKSEDKNCNLPSDVLPKPNRVTVMVSSVANGSVSNNPLDKNPVMILNELHPNLIFDLTSETRHPQGTFFKITVVVEGHVFEGIGSSKKLAKVAAAKAALATLHLGNLETGKPGCNFSGSNHCMDKLPQSLADFIARQVQEKFITIHNSSSSYNGRKILAGIVMLRGSDIKGAEVVAVTTGTKCINSKHMSTTGQSINDCHAEIVARRCLLDFFYRQLELHLDSRTAPLSIFYVDYECGGFRLHDGVRFHLYISTAPCGDARIFSFNEGSPQGHEVNGDRHPNRKAHGKLRTKFESGTIPVKQQESVQTWDGILQGQRLLTMSCSDKIARWNVLGLQGSLLSHFLTPIYLDSVIVGSLFHPQHMHRALCGRLAGSVQDLSSPFLLNVPLMNGASNSEQHQLTKMPKVSLNWTLGESTYEIVNCTTGKTESGQPSRLCKYHFFERFRVLYDRLPVLVRSHMQNPPLSYLDAKMRAIDYQQAKKQLYQAFQRAKLGTWVKKPIEQDSFELIYDQYKVLIPLLKEDPTKEG